ncbi:MAG: S8 family serine peptidase [Euryarchaeota archaeon]|jgi:subtilisin family serine protease|nr:S8 family serine peptidase [Euryarchaeota archaeon]
MVLPLIGSIQPAGQSPLETSYPAQILTTDQTSEIPTQTAMPMFGELPWWEYTTLDSNRNRIHDSLETAVGPVNVGLSYDHTPTIEDEAKVQALGHTVNQLLHSVDALLIGTVNASDVWALAQLDGVVMVERYGILTFYGDIQTPAVKARNSSFYPVGAWDLGVTGEGVNIALTDTGVDEEHPGLVGKFVAGYDAVCYLHTDPTCLLAGGRETDGTFNPDDGNQHGTACMGMASATGLEADGSQSNFTGAAPDAKLVDVRIGTDAGAGPFENYFLEQEFYESAMNGVQWIIDNRDTAWQGADEQDFGIDIISLSWGITSHEGGGSDGEDMHSRILNEAVEVGITPSVAAGNDGPDNDGLSGMGSSSLSVTVGATDDINTIQRGDDTVAGYSSRGPRRDNGDSNPYNELKPEISAPGTNIIQAEGCVTSGSCNNLFSDASQNTYTGRGSGTSYATPSVSGVIALVIEANPDLDPLQIKEVLKQTAERRGPASAPDVDPYWNRDFGYGMVDAYEAVKLAQHLNVTSQSASIDPYIQNHILEYNVSGSTARIAGHSWGQQGVIDRVEFRVAGGDWHEVAYDVAIEEIPAGTPFTWNITLDADKLSAGNQSVEIRAVSGEMTSLPSIVNVQGTGAGANASSGGFVLYAVGLALVVMLLAAVLGWRMHRVSEHLSTDSPSLGKSGGSVLDAELVNNQESEISDLELCSVAELKQMLEEKGLKKSGNKSELIERLRHI